MNSQKSHEKMLRLALGNADSNCNDNYDTSPKCLKLKRLTLPSIGEDVEQLEFSYIVEGNKKMTQPL